MTRINTNQLTYWLITYQVVMNFLEGKKQLDELDFKWIDYFDMVIVGGNKPAFIVDDGYNTI